VEVLIPKTPAGPLEELPLSITDLEQWKPKQIDMKDAINDYKAREGFLVDAYPYGDRRQAKEAAASKTLD